VCSSDLPYPLEPLNGGLSLTINK